MIDITLLRDRSRLRQYPKGAVISGSGRGAVMFAVLSGDILIIAGYGTPKIEQVAMLGAGTFHIDAALLDEDKALYTAVAASDAVLLPVEKSAIYDFMLGEPELAGEIVRELTNRRDTAALQGLGGSVGSGPCGGAPERESNGFTLFPIGHRSCALPVGSQDGACLMEKATVCPVCGVPFQALSVRPSRLAVERTDSDMRIRYKGVEPLYYEVLTCPGCLYSALRDVFEIPERRRQDIRRELSGAVGCLAAEIHMLTDSDAVFARYYLALRCAPVCFAQHHYLSARLLYIMSRLYQDAGNTAMEEETAARALAAFDCAYQSERMTPRQEQQVCVLLGELYLKQNDLKKSALYFSKARSRGEKRGVLRRHAEDRMYDIRAIAAAR